MFGSQLQLQQISEQRYAKTKSQFGFDIGSQCLGVGLAQWSLVKDKEFVVQKIFIIRL